MVAAHASKWIQSCCPYGGAPQRLHFVQDHDRCLWQDESMRTLRHYNLDPLLNFPRSSPDLNLIETVWHRLKQALDDSAPESIEERPNFLVRLHGCVRRLNGSMQSEVGALANQLPQRAAAILAAKPPGAHTIFYMFGHTHIVFK